MKKIFITGLMALASLNMSYALDEEFMVVTLKDGTTVEYNVANVERVNFDLRHTDDAFTVVNTDGTTDAYVTIPTLLRVRAAETGAATQFGFGTVQATDAQGLTQGDYGVYLSVSAAKLYAGDIDLATETDSYVLKLVKYENGDTKTLNEKVTSGTLSTKINNKNNNVTISLDAVFEDGVAVTAKYAGRPVDVESLDAMIPAKKYGNEAFYYDSSEKEYHASVTDVRKSFSSYSKKTTLTFDFDNMINGEQYIKIIFSEALMNSTETTFNLAETAGWELRLGTIQLCGYDKDDSSIDWKNAADNGTMILEHNPDGTIHIYMEVQNYYNNYMGTHLGTHEKVIFNYVGSIE